MGTRGREPRASALGWYETGPWPESEGAFSSAQIGKRGGRYIRIYIVPIYSRCSDALLSRLLKNSVLHPRGEGYSLRGCGDAVGQTNIPPPLALVHTQKDAGGTGRMIGGCVEQQKIWPQLRDRDRVAAEHQTDPDISGMAAMTGEHGTHG